MKNKYILYIACAALTVIVSCKRESFLNRTPLSDIVPANYFKNETDLQLYCNQYYPALTIQNFLKQDLIDEMVITRVPVLLGSGIPLFTNDLPELKFEHTATEVYDNVLVKSSYIRKR